MNQLSRQFVLLILQKIFKQTTDLEQSVEIVESQLRIVLDTEDWFEIAKEQVNSLFLVNEKFDTKITESSSFVTGYL